MEGLPVPMIIGGAVFCLMLVVFIAKMLRRKLARLIVGVKEQLFTAESVVVCMIYVCVAVGLTGVVQGARMLFLAP